MRATKEIREKCKIYFLAFLILISIGVWGLIFSSQNTGLLTVAFLDVGQGDAVFIETPDGKQILIDGGPDKKILKELSKVMPFFDRTIDMIIVSNPDSDHIAGLLDVLGHYDVKKILEPGTFSKTKTYREFEQMIQKEGAEKLTAKEAMQVNLGKGVNILILFPDKNVASWKTNDGSIIAKLIYKNTSFLFTGDTPEKIEGYLLNKNFKNLDSDVLKVAHHGSKYSTSENFLKAVTPGLAVISVGLNNKYGHPNKEIIDRLEKNNIKIKLTSRDGAIILKSDGQKIFK